MVRLIINGCGGKMGKVLAEAAVRSGRFVVAAGVDPAGDADAEYPVYASVSAVREAADVIIDFSVPEALEGTLAGAREKKLPVVVATTGLSETHLQLMEGAAQHIAVFQAANMSLGINLLKSLARQAASVLGSTFDIEIIEKHHRTKRDAPSGTALVLAETLKSVVEHPVEYVFGRKDANRLRRIGEIGIHAVRAGNIVGEHDVLFAGEDEVVTLQHTAYAKGLFASGALKAAEYIVRKPTGFYLMEHMIAESGTVMDLNTSDAALVSFKRIPGSIGNSHHICEVFSQAGISIDMISQTNTDEGFHSLSFSIDSKDAKTAGKVLKELQEQENTLSGTLFTDLCKLTVDGIGMETQSGAALTVFGILDALQVESKAVSTAEKQISLLIGSDHREPVINQLKEHYNLP